MTEKTGPIQHFSAGERIFSAGDAADGAYLVQHGQVAMYAPGSDHPLAILSEGEIFGEMAVLDNSPRILEARAHSDCDLLVIKRNQIYDRLEQADPVLRALFEVLLSRLRSQVAPNSAHAQTPAYVVDRSRNNPIINVGLEKIKLEADLLEALEKDDIQMVFQPLVNLKDDAWAGFEALCRWQHESIGQVSPEEFISLAEETDLIVPLGIRIFEKACEFLHRLDTCDGAQRAFFMSINVSARQLAEDDFVQRIGDIVRQHGIAPERIKLEITETLMVDYQQARQLLQPLHDLGFTLSLDDFGTGYSGLQHLIELDFHTIKIDQRFVSSMFENARSLTMINVVTDMAANMDIEVVAEGIENAQQRRVLQALGVDLGQGYLFSPPLDAGQALAQLCQGPSAKTE